MKGLFLTFALLFVSTMGWAQVDADTLRARLEKQYYEYPQEKIHITTDRNHYMGCMWNCARLTTPSSSA